MKDLVFARTWQNNREPVSQSFAALTRFLSKRVGRKVAPKVSLSYEELSRGLREGTIDVAWLPPIVHAHLLRDRSVQTLLVSARARRSTCVIVCRREGRIATVDDLRNTRAAWVDPWSAAGYVMARLFLFEHGIDPRKDLLEERFLGSHDAAVRAVAEGVSDFTSTFARLDDKGEVVAAGWRSLPEGDGLLRIVSIVGPVPLDVVAVRSGLPTEERDTLRAALEEAIADPEYGPAARASFEVDGLCAPSADDDSFELLTALEKAGSLFPR